MKCERCGKNEANIHMKNFVNGEFTELNICDQCAKIEELNFEDFSLESLVSNIVENMNISNGLKTESVNLDSENRCKNCGMDYGEFKKTGYLGCDNCYNVYRDELKNIIKRMNGSSKHQGKMPKRFVNNEEKLTEVEQKELELNRAIEEENYERAACLRDEIKILKESREED